MQTSIKRDYIPHHLFFSIDTPPVVCVNNGLFVVLFPQNSGEPKLVILLQCAFRGSKKGGVFTWELVYSLDCFQRGTCIK